MSQTVRGVTREESTGVAVVRTDAEEIDADATVRHYDQLSERSQTAIAAAVDGRRTTRVPELSPGDVVRYTGYYEIR